ncbi:two-component system response regulator DcuR [Paenibacillus sp. 19GGS1-52]|uniref:two-component system response regulator DcuR n=1 Tax=Paenibacillus sp. 19GGS1-52 TaxID=2758563 RepID=UPI001EFAC9B8|nr:two-component system response regulator DcuR [Paenibacillus sp. 19GGS1-52]ULO06043.1 two-component system response regulator DcuR [Paenibacillus sp. 19GGS1-52]
MTIKVLIVEDDPMVAKINRHYLELIEGFQCVGWATSGDEAKKLLAEQKVDLILLDIYMSQTNGLQLLTHLRGQGSTVDVIVISAASDNISIRQALQHGAVDYLIKPFEFTRFQAALTGYQKNHQLMKRGEHLSQEQLDKLIHRQATSKQRNAELPKGLTDATLSSIWNIINELNQSTFSTEDITSHAAISRISVRKYLAFLEELGVLSMESSYGSIGRPVYMYSVTSEGHEILAQFL